MRCAQSVSLPFPKLLVSVLCASAHSSSEETREPSASRQDQDDQEQLLRVTCGRCEVAVALPWRRGLTDVFMYFLCFRIIYKCSMCDTVFTLQTLLYRHFDQHIENQKVSVFKCPDCSLLYAQKQLMMDHIKSMHGTLKSIEGPPNLGINLPLSIKPATQNSANQNKEDTRSMNGKDKLEKKSPSPVKKSMESKKVSSPGWTCWECDRLFTQRDVYISHVRKEHGKVSVHGAGSPHLGPALTSDLLRLSLTTPSLATLQVEQLDRLGHFSAVHSALTCLCALAFGGDARRDTCRVLAAGLQRELAWEVIVARLGGDVNVTSVYTLKGFEIAFGYGMVVDFPRA
ncbi:Zinc finger protein 532 [Galemys pyrenaicus]|uniref:Zinc finger protein 532 n=1 Tax=Galemys pyrenaicus TaxID=202257 RepID=A0A8J5ZSP5_GALPY|nr:Zinc finger protein 532 [Galemys pyrenaicus]